MSAAAVLEADPGELIRQGWKALVDSLGIQKATQFVVLLERGQGDSVQDIAQYWGDASIETIHSRVTGWATNRPGSTS